MGTVLRVIGYERSKKKYSDQENKMIEKEILQQALFKAINNGFNKTNNRIYRVTARYPELKDTLTVDYYRGIIFDHEFAKAFWGEECYYQDEESQLLDGILCWQYHLKIMISSVRISKRPNGNNLLTL